ncbi:hypothetical protein [Citricoccus alkalitolerans]|uniref:Uncharacterized protein n=1 Tax=Citricoccus alkalitolerans TaxID=246603 RepID=A0ABV8XZE7_9MICC
MPLIGSSHRVAFTFDNESEARDCYTRLQDALPDLVLEQRIGKDIPESWTVHSDVDSESTGPQIQALADVAILFGPVDDAARQMAETETN